VKELHNEHSTLSDTHAGDRPSDVVRSELDVIGWAPETVDLGLGEVEQVLVADD
jgi:hypothetical protein